MQSVLGSPGHNLHAERPPLGNTCMPRFRLEKKAVCVQQLHRAAAAGLTPHFSLRGHRFGKHHPSVGGCPGLGSIPRAQGASHKHGVIPLLHVVPWGDADALWCVGAARLQPLPPALAGTGSKMGNYWF